MRNAIVTFSVAACVAICGPAVQAQSAPFVSTSTNTDAAVLPKGAPNQDALLRRAAVLRAQWAARGEAARPAALPSIKSASFANSPVNVIKPPAGPEVTLKLKSGESGISSIQINMISPSGMQGIFGGYSLPPYPPQQPPSQTLTILVTSLFGGGGFNIFTEAGTWTVTNITLLSGSGSIVSYSGSALAEVFPNNALTVINPVRHDTTLPSFGTGTILTPTVSLSSPSPYFAANLEVAHKTFGVTSLNLSIQPPGNGFPLESYSEIPAPITKGTALTFDELSEGDPVGTYTITGIMVCDIAGHCLNDNSAADIQAAFGTTTFQVTQ